MAGALESFFEQQRKRGVQLSGAPKKQLTKALQQKGKAGQGKKITAAELAKGRAAYTKSGGTDYLATIGRTYKPTQLSKDVKSRLQKAGFGLDESGYYTQSGPITGSVLNKALSAGYDPQEVRSYLAGNFAQSALDDQISKFLGQGGQYKLDPTTGRWSKQSLDVGPNAVAGLGTVTGGQGIYGGINPDAAPGATPFEMEYAAAIDPYKIQAKSAERLGRLGQATDLLGRKMAYGTEYDIAKMNRLQNLQQAQIQQANYLYNLIPSAF